MLDVRIGELPPPPEPEDPEDDDEGETEEEKQTRQIVEQVLEMQRRLQYNKLMGEPILQLPESIDDPDAPSPSDNASDSGAESSDVTGDELSS